jgi:nucleoside-diphosphate-sugar epimerase
LVIGGTKLPPSVSEDDMKILLTGADGFIGRKLCCELKMQHEVTALGMHARAVGDSIDYRTLDVTDGTAVDALFSSNKFNVVIHLAAVTFHDDIMKKKRFSLGTSLRGTENVIIAFNKYCSGARFIYTSTGKVYGGREKQPINELTPLRPTNVLGRTKRMTEELIEYYSEDNVSNHFIILRMFNIYGYGQRPTFVIPHIIEQLKAGDTLNLGNLNDARDYLNIDDLARCFMSLIEKNKATQKNRIETYNIGSGEAHTVSDILEYIRETTRRKLLVHIDTVKLRNDETSIEYADISKISATTGWHPQITLESGIKEILKKEGLI